jgi:hypothetical protein
MRNACKILVGKPEGRDHLEDLGVDGKTIRLDLRQIRWEGVDWMYLAQDRNQCRVLLNTKFNFRVP